jgi:hypothetical protein
MNDLWPEDIGHPTLKSPVSILREQASFLGDKTQNLVRAKISPHDKQEQNNFKYTFFIVAPELGDYHHALFKIRHDVELYPVVIETDEEIHYELAPEEDTTLIANSESEFLGILRKIFTARKTKKIIHALIAQSSAYQDISY